MLLKDKVVIVSGIGPGLGQELSTLAAKEGAKAVVIAARTAAKLDVAEQEIKDLGLGTAVLKVPTDISDQAQCQALADRAVAEFGRIDVLCIRHQFNTLDTQHTLATDLHALRFKVRVKRISREIVLIQGLDA